MPKPAEQLAVRRPSLRVLTAVRTIRLLLAPFPSRRHPPELVTYRRLADVPPEVVAGLAASYVQLFSERPWRRPVPLEYPRRKLAHELAGDDVWLTVQLADDGFVEGFCWGAVIQAADVPARILTGSSLPPETRPRLAAVAEALGRERVVFCDEIAVAHQRRGSRDTLETVIRVSLTMLSLARANRTGIACWTLRRSPVVRLLTRCFGFQVVERLGEIVLLWVPPGLASDIAVIATRLPLPRVLAVVRFALRHQVLAPSG